MNGLKNLQILVIANNELTTIPKEINLLIDLRIFNLSNNFIKNEGISEEFFDLISLTDLNLSNNQLTSLERFERLTLLQKLNVANNMIQEIPDEICFLQDLKFFWIQNNGLKKISKHLGLLTSLKMILILGNQELDPLTRQAGSVGLSELISQLKS